MTKYQRLAEYILTFQCVKSSAFENRLKKIKPFLPLKLKENVLKGFVI